MMLSDAVFWLFVAGLALGFGMIGWGIHLAHNDARKLRPSTFSEPITDSELDDAFDLAELHIVGEG